MVNRPPRAPLDTATVKATLEHVAKTLTIGDLPLPLPVQIKGSPLRIGCGWRRFQPRTRPGALGPEPRHRREI